MKKFRFTYLILMIMSFSFLILCSCKKEHIHEWTEISKTTATCTESGKITYQCYGCEETKVEVIEQATGHIEVIDIAVEATCTTTGLTEGKHCSKCSEVLIVQEIVAKVDHIYEAEIVEPTCEKQGYTIHTCLCGDTYTDSKVDALGHTFKSIVTEPTGLSEGYVTYICETCEYSYKDNFVPALTYTITWKNWDGTVLEIDENIEYGTTPSYDDETPTKESNAQYTYTFSSWDKKISEVTADVVYTAQYEAIVNRYTVIWKNWDGTVLEIDENIEYGTTPSYDDETPTKESDAQYTYTFSGWDKKISEVTADVVYTAQYEAIVNRYTVIWKNWDGTVLEIDELVEYGVIPSFDLEDPTKPMSIQHYYIFTGWDKEISAVTGDITYTAQFEKCECTYFTITFDLRGGSWTSTSQIKNKGETITLPSTKPTLANHIFAGWNNGYENKIYQAGDTFSLDLNLTLYAVWEEKCLSCDGNGEIDDRWSCSNCNGTGTTGYTDFCANCQGEGKRHIYSSCTGCSGSGYFYTYVCTMCSYTTGYTNSSTPPQYICPKCRNGSMVRESKEACPVCSGNGKTYEGYYECPTCNGKGYISVTTTCSSCSGVGHGGSVNDCTKCNETGIIRIAAPLVESTVYNKIVLKAIDGYQYSIDNINWQDSNVFEGLSSSTSYTFYQREKTNDGVTFGPSSYPLTVKTPSVPIYNITYNLDGGTHSNPTSYTIESNDIVLTSPTRNGYTFIGWLYSDITEPVEEVIINAGSTGNRTFTAVWELNTYNISYSLDGGTNNTPNITEYTVLDENIILSIPTKEHYDFAGWKSDGNIISVIDTSSGKDYDLIATWVPHEYSIIYDLDDGTITSPTSYTIESETILLVAPTKSGYTFIGWTYDEQMTPVMDVIIPKGTSGDKEYKANWQANTYSITLDGNGAELGNNSIPVIYNEEFTLPEITRPGYTLKGWYNGDKLVENGKWNIASDVVLVANWSVNQYSITYEDVCWADVNVTLNYNYEGSTNSIVTLSEGETLNYPSVPTRSGYAFSGWYTDAACTNSYNFIGTITQDITLYAKWVAMVDTYSSREYVPIECFVDSSFRMGISTSGSSSSNRNYYYFTCYQSGSYAFYAMAEGSYGSCYIVVYNVTKERTIIDGSNLYSSHYTWNSFTANAGDVIYVSVYGTNVEGGSFYVSKVELPTSTAIATSSALLNAKYSADSTLSDVVTFDETFDLLVPSRQYYDFQGWYNGDKLVENGKWNIASDVVLVAKWKRTEFFVTYTDVEKINDDVIVTLNYNYNGSTNSIIALSEGETLNYPSVPTRSGYAFSGWYTTSSCTGTPYDFSGKITKNLTLYAKWVSMVSSYTSREYFDIANYNSSSSKKTLNINASSSSSPNYYYFTCYKTGTYELYVAYTYGDFYIYVYNATKGTTVLSQYNLYSGKPSTSTSFTASAGDVIYVKLYKYSSSGSTGTGTLYVSGASYPTSTAVANNELKQYNYVEGETITTLVALDSSFELFEPNRTGYAFQGWYNGDELVESGKWNIESDVVLVAKWKRIVYPITYNLDGGTNPATNPLSYNINYEVTLAAPTKPGYIFIGWTGSNGDIPQMDVIISGSPSFELEYTANWELAVYNVEYVLYGGVNPNKNPAVITIYDDFELKEPTKTGYTFDKWYLDEEFTLPISSLTNITSDITLYARFIPNDYFVTFLSEIVNNKVTITLNHGDGTTSSYVVNKGSTFNPYQYSKITSGSSFEGWYTDSTKQNKLTETSELVINKNTTLYGKRVYFSSEYSKFPSNEFYTKESYYVVPDNVYEIYVEASIYYYNSGVYQVNIGHYIRNVTKGEELFYESEIASPKETVRLQHSGYYTVSPGDVLYMLKEDSSRTLKIKVTKTNSTTIKVESCTTIQTIYFDSSIPNESILGSDYLESRKGYKFLGWEDEEGNLCGETWEFLENKVLTARWEIINYSISYNLDGGTNSSFNPGTYTVHDSIELQDPTKEGYTFDGWYIDSSFTKKITRINKKTGNYILYAKFTANSYEVNFNFNGGIIAPQLTFISDNEIIGTYYFTIEHNLSSYYPPEKDGYIFAGWYLDEQYQNVFEFSQVITENTKLYAKWIENSNIQHKITSIDIESKSILINGTNEIKISFVPLTSGKITILTESQLDLKGILYNSNMVKVAEADDISDENYNFSITYSVEAGEIYTISIKGATVLTTGDCNVLFDFEENMGISGSTYTSYSISVLYDSSFDIANPTKEGFEFVGWFDENGIKVDSACWKYSSNTTIYANWKIVE